MGSSNRVVGTLLSVLCAAVLLSSLAPRLKHDEGLLQSAAQTTCIGSSIDQQDYDGAAAVAQSNALASIQQRQRHTPLTLMPRQQQGRAARGARGLAAGGCFGSKPEIIPSPPFMLYEHDVTESTLTLSWHLVNRATQYELQIKEPGDEWRSVFNGTGNFARKKNLRGSTDYQFRMRYYKDGNYSDFCEPLTLTTIGSELAATRMPMPIAKVIDGTTVRVIWDKPPRTLKSELQVKDEDGGPWVTVSTELGGSSARKRGLKAGHGYLFRTRGLNRDTMQWGAFSEPTEIVHTMSLHPNIRDLFGKELQNAQGERVSTDVLAGKVVGVYFSAHWCPPCRQFTPHLANFYKKIKETGTPFEIVFVSHDQDGYGFRLYLQEMPWLAVPFRGFKREALMKTFGVQGIPSLKILSPKGQVVCNDGVRTPLSADLLTRWANVDN